MDTEKESFLYQSINDTQATIRALDTKLGFLFVVYLSPFTSTTIITEAYKSTPALVALLIIMWFWGVISLYSGLTPKKPHKTNSKSRFFNADLYSPKISYIPPLGLNTESKIPLTMFIESLPNNTDESIQHLAMEAMTLTYIRQSKSTSTSSAILAAMLIVIITALNFVASIIS